MTYLISQIAEVLDAQVCGAQEVPVDWLLTDSRSLCYPEGTLFFAIRSPRNDGHKYIEELYERGVRAFVVEHLPEGDALHPDAVYLQVPSSLQALQALARHHRSRFSIPVVGITGSNGKTIVKEWLAALLRPSVRTTRSPRSYNSQVGVPLSVWQIDRHTEVAIIEAGISEPGEMQRLEPIVEPTIGILTHLGAAHQENFSSMEEKCREKLRLMQHCKTLIYCADNETVARCVEEFNPYVERFGWSATDEQAPAFLVSAEQEEGEWTVLRYRITPAAPENLVRGEYVCRIPFADNAAVENAMYCICAARLLGLEGDEIAERAAKWESIAMRMEVKEGKNGCILVNDCYNSDLSSLEIALDFLYRRSQSCGLSRTLILSDLLETGEEPEELYRKISGLIRRRDVRRVVGIGSRVHLLSIPGMSLFASTGEFLASPLPGELRDEVILLKGARSFRFERIVEALSRKVHETILEVNLTALAENLNEYRARLKPETKMVCMVKASAYGAGSIEVAKTLQDLRVDYLAVAVADEGVALRNAGIRTGIIVMNPEMAALPTLFEYGLEPEVYNFRLLEALLHSARLQGITNFPVHIKVDTGMHRMGFAPADMARLGSILQRQSTLLPRSVFSHLAGSDSAEFDDFTHRQIETFRAAARELQSFFPHKIIRHILNTAGIERFPEHQMEMVRLGLGLYGISPVDNRPLHPVSSLRTTILQLRDVAAGETVGYSRRGRILRPSRIADIPIGYADGLDRHLGNGRGYCLVHGRKAPFVGNICMDVAMVDVSGIPCAEGDPVELFGPELPVTVLSDALGTIPYEVLTSVSERVKRVYIQES